jgi:hypothetical protein
MLPHTCKNQDYTTPKRDIKTTLLVLNVEHILFLHASGESSISRAEMVQVGPISHFWPIPTKINTSEGWEECN